MKFQKSSKAWPWPNNANLALSIVVNVEEGAEASILDGDKYPEPVDEMGIALKRPIRNFGNESNYQYGIKRGAPRVMRLLEAHGIQATFTACALALERAPEFTREIVRQGHEVTSHGYRWAHQFNMNEDEERAYIRKAVASIEQSTGRKPVGWLSRYLTTPNTRRLLIEEGFLYHMDDLSDDEPFWDQHEGRPIVVLPYQVDNNDMKMWSEPSYTPDQWLKYAIDNFEWTLREGEHEINMMSIGLHLRIIGRPGRIGALEKFLAHVKKRSLEPGGPWIATRQAIAEHFAHQVPFAAA
ncbi:polysaccharide deacetylase family protein [Caenimonas soli]|uniref:polysaccharide deacetylase family protein n=1 Tax=Caenimonas soli TaxID=2735555 RepID=UPI001553BE82|nr:polysaccharide deacetylase family protein [Caenimonas soli]NPC56958.1 polysaccharide deacetylase family protein [Caenimonas soli]